MSKTIKSKIILILVVSLMSLTLVLTLLSSIQIKDQLIKDSYAKLTSLRDLKKDHLIELFDNYYNDINVLSQDRSTQELTKKLNKHLHELNIAKDGLYPYKHEKIIKSTLEYQKFYDELMNVFSFYDVFIISVDGHVMFTHAKESDLGQNIRTGELKMSGLGEIYSKVISNKKTSIVDMKIYPPSNNDPAMFIGTPITEDGSLIAVLALQISDKDITKNLSFRKGYGETQEDYLVGIDKLMRSDSFLDPKNRSLRASFKNPKSGMIDTVAVRNALAGKSNTEVIIDYNGNPVLSAYAPVKIKDLQWAIISEIDEAEILEVPNRLTLYMIIEAICLMILVIFIAYMIINKIIVSRISQFQSNLNQFFDYLGRKTDNVKLLPIDTYDEIGQMTQQVNVQIESIQKELTSDHIVIQEIIEVLNEFSEGTLNKRVKNTTTNPLLQEITELLNNMASNLELNIKNILNVLYDYADYKYKSKIEIDDKLKDHLLDLSIGVNKLGESITQMLVQSKNSGLELDIGSDTLLENVHILNVNAHESATALEETAAALEEITGTISATTGNIVKMSALASDVIDAVGNGESLANETTKAMDEINQKVSAINDAISVIDQIAFQTNILSLNAAVEAATAGEAGKGFAVVAGEVRNLASRSTEAASEIKMLVESATFGANNGKRIADEMINGYTKLNSTIETTLTIISGVECASKEQLKGLEQINNSISALDAKTQENASIASKTNSIAQETDALAKNMLRDVDQKDFEGKGVIEIKEKKAFTSNVSENNEKRISEKSISLDNKMKPLQIIKEENDDNEWESF